MTELFNPTELEEHTKSWGTRKVSNFEYLLYLNLISGRLWADYSRYPVFPWTLFSFEGAASELRDFEFPVFAQTDEQRFRLAADFTNVSETENRDFLKFSSSLSAVCGLVGQLEPFTTLCLRKTEDLSSVLTSFNRLKRSDGLSELTPEFYFMAEVFQNFNGLRFDDVQLPFWAETPQAVVSTFRSALESDDVSGRLHEWIDLVFGFRREGTAALERFNIFPPLPGKETASTRKLFDLIEERGLQPPQLFREPHPRRSKGGQPKKIRFDFYEQLRLDADLGIRKLSPDLVPIILDRKVELRSKGKTVRCLNFREEMRPLLVDSHDQLLSVGHATPVVSVWRISAKEAERTAFLRGHISRISALRIQTHLNLLVAGYEDGAVSVFVVSPLTFLRTFRCPKKPVTALRVSPINSNVFVLQQDTIRPTVSLWSINGGLITSSSFERQILDFAFTSSDEGVRDNVLVLLFAGGCLRFLRDEDFAQTQPDIVVDGATKIVIQKNEVLLVATDDKMTTVFKIN